MKFRFDANQDYQVDAINSVIDLFEGQLRIEPELTFHNIYNFAVISNRHDLQYEILLKNLTNVQIRNQIKPDEEVKAIELEGINTAQGEKTIWFPNYSIEMETGTGKTYIYLRTIFELYRRYGMLKFIIVVPKVAIREGVIKTLKITEEHFRELYGNIPYRYFAYDSEKISQIRQFVLSTSIEIMIITIDSFNKATNIFKNPTEKLQDEIPLHMVQATRPVLILDEPQNMESQLSVNSLAELEPLFALRYSATHLNPYSLIYRLTPHGAYKQGLVKRVEVLGLEEQNKNWPFMLLKEVNVKKQAITAKLIVHKLMNNGTIKEKLVSLKAGECLGNKTNRPEYAPYIVEEINVGEGWVRFFNGTMLHTGEATGDDKEAIFRAQIRYTIETHFVKQNKLKPLGIKVLSLFFIDKVSNFTEEDGMIRRLFIQTFNELKKQYPEWSHYSPEDVWGYYFASKRKRNGEIVYEDSTTGEAEKDKAVYNLIMRDKERLLSFEEPMCFIFSHSALREGWDNPNIFQICTLSQGVSLIKKRQEIGRGIRICVNQSGERLHEEEINVLTLIANENYEQYVATYQDEVRNDFGDEEPGAKITDARKTGTIKLREDLYLSEEFGKLWGSIKQKTRYMVSINSNKLIEDVVAELETLGIDSIHITAKLGRIVVESSENGQQEFAATLISSKMLQKSTKSILLPNLVETIFHILENNSLAMKLTKRTIIEILKRLSNKETVTKNPQEFAIVTANIIKAKLADQLVNGIKYVETSECYQMKRILEQKEIPKVPVEYMVKTKKGIYDHVMVDSIARSPSDGNEAQFVEQLEKNEQVKMYLKLPRWFMVKTPIGNYNPDWAIVKEEKDLLGQLIKVVYLVRESKTTSDLDKLRPNEKRKVLCGMKHFEAIDVDYKISTNGLEL